MREPDTYVQLKDRLVAWWHGREAEISATTARPSDIQVDRQPIVARSDWTPERLLVVQKLWGDGFTAPGGIQAALQVARLTKIDGKNTVLDLTAGLGGTAATICREANLWMEAVEPNPAQAKKAFEHISRMGLGSRISVSTDDPGKLALHARKYDLVYSQARLFAFPDKAAILQRIAPALKSNAQLFLTDFVVGEEPDSTPRKTWIANERTTPHAWTQARYILELEQLGFTSVSFADQSLEYKNSIHTGWMDLARRLEKEAFDRKLVALLMQEGQIWQARARALGDGAIRMLQIRARSPNI